MTTGALLDFQGEYDKVQQQLKIFQEVVESKNRYVAICMVKAHL
jgi:hypothetical protein